MMPEKAPVPLYRKLIADLRKDIDNGIYKKGDILPSENELCKTYKTTRPTVRQALSELMNSGYIVRRKGKGSIVNEPKKALGILSISGVTAGVGARNLKTLILQKPVKMPWPGDFPHDLSEMEKEAGCIYFSRIRYIRDVPVLYEETFIANLLPHFTRRNLENKSLFKILRQFYDLEIKEGMQMISAIKAKKPFDNLLNVKAGSPIVHMKRKLRTNVKDLNLYSWLYCNTEEYYLEDYF